MADAADTIAAVATAPGRGGIGIVRLSGPAAGAIASAICGIGLRPRHAHHAVFRDATGEAIDDGIALRFPAPRSYTGEEVVELQAHGSPVLLHLLLARCLELGARAARPGEFTERAWRHHKLDLAQAEAVADLIAAGSEAAARAARRSLDGAFSRRVEALLDRLTALRIQVEAAIDFPDEDIDVAADAALQARLAGVEAAHATLLVEAARGQRLRDGLHVVLVGAPNVGKSSLLNAIAGAERAIVTAIPGTTRDLLRESVLLDGVELTLVDTAGLHASADPIEREGMRRAQAELAKADLVMAVVDARDPDLPAGILDVLATADVASQRVLWLHNKADLLAAAPDPEPSRLWVSATRGDGMDLLRARLRGAAGAWDGHGSGFQGAGLDGAGGARGRHVEALRRVGVHLAAARARLAEGAGAELAADDLRVAQAVLGEITGVTTSDDLLGAIFASFCIGK